MELWSQSFFCRDGSGIKARVRFTIDDDTYPISLHILPTKDASPRTDFYLTEEAFVAFKNSVVHAYEEYLKQRREVVGPYEWTEDAKLVLNHMEGVVTGRISSDD